MATPKKKKIGKTKRKEMFETLAQLGLEARNRYATIGKLLYQVAEENGMFVVYQVRMAEFFTKRKKLIAFRTEKSAEDYIIRILKPSGTVGSEKKIRCYNISCARRGVLPANIPSMPRIREI